MNGQVRNMEYSGSLNAIKSVYFIGIGGIGMSALARYCKAKGILVCGYDKTATELTQHLITEGIEVSQDENFIPTDVDLIVFTPAVPASHRALTYYRENGYQVVKRSDLLQLITEDGYNICVAGTHGKTTVSTMIAHLLTTTEFGCTAFLGGISVNYNTNFWTAANKVTVVEADEYDRSFLKLSPDIAVITAMDADHLDIYGTEAAMQEAFVEFSNRVKENGVLISKFGLKALKSTEVKNRKTYSLQNDAADLYAKNIRIEDGGYLFDVVLGDKTVDGLRLKVGGMHNVENMVAALGVIDELEIDLNRIRSGVESFKGVKRRFEYIIPPATEVKGGFVQPVLIDDYAHHPEELKALLNSVRSLFPERVMTVVFQPHLFSRTKDFADGFAQALSIADQVILLPIYPARELPVEGVSSELILNRIDKEEKAIVEKEQLTEWLRKRGVNKEFGEVMIMAGAGDIDTLIQPVKNLLLTLS